MRGCEASSETDPPGAEKGDVDVGAIHKPLAEKTLADFAKQEVVGSLNNRTYRVGLVNPLRR